jgi:hypothetical protein
MRYDTQFVHWWSLAWRVAQQLFVPDSIRTLYLFGVLVPLNATKGRHRRSVGRTHVLFQLPLVGRVYDVVLVAAAGELVVHRSNRTLVLSRFH